MSTRSRIGIMNPDGTVTSVYCHNDGYLEAPHGVGSQLYMDFQDPARIADLLAKGNRSSLMWAGSLDGRVYGSADNAAVTSPGMEAFGDLAEEFVYLYRDGAWYVSDHGASFVLLTEALVTNRLTA